MIICLVVCELPLVQSCSFRCNGVGSVFVLVMKSRVFKLRRFENQPFNLMFLIYVNLFTVLFDLILVISFLLVSIFDNFVNFILFLISASCDAFVTLFLFRLKFLAFAIIYVGVVAVLFLFVVTILSLKVFSTKGIVPYSFFVDLTGVAA